MNHNAIHQQIFVNTFKCNATKVGVVLASTKEPGPYFNPKRNTGYIKSKLNPIPVMALTETLSPYSLIARSLGLKETGAVKLTIENCDVALLKMAEKIIINGEDYAVYSEALGNRFQLFPLKFGFSRVIIFKDTKHG